MKTALSHPQLFGSGSTNQRRLAGAPDPVSGLPQPIAAVPVHLMHCGPLAGGRQAHAGSARAQVPVILIADQSDASSRYEAHVAWQAPRGFEHFCLVRMLVRALASAPQELSLAASHNALLPYQRASFTPSPASSSS